MKTECSAESLQFHGLGRRAVVGRFDGDKLSSDSGGVLLREVEQRTHILKRLAGCFVDHRDPQLLEHTGVKRGPIWCGFMICVTKSGNRFFTFYGFGIRVRIDSRHKTEGRCRHLRFAGNRRIKCGGMPASKRASTPFSS